MTLRTLRRKGVVGLLAAAVMVVVMAAPAAANPYNFDVTDGTIRTFNQFGFPQGDIELGPGAGVSCDSTASAEFDGTSSSGTFTASVTSASEFAFQSTTYYAEITGTTTTSGSYSSATGGYDLTGLVVSFTADIYEEGGTECVAGPAICTVTAPNVALSGLRSNGEGLTTSGALPGGLASGDVAVLNGGNSPGDVDASGCSNPWLALDNGRVQIIDLELTIP